MADQIRVDWEYLRAARHKYRKLVLEIGRGASRADMEHTASKLGIFLDTALFGAFSGSAAEAPDVLPESASHRGGEGR